MAPERKNDDGTAAGAAARKSKKQAAAASGSTATDLKISEGDWTSSSVKEATLTKLRNDGLLPHADKCMSVRHPRKRYCPNLMKKSGYYLLRPCIGG